VTGETETRLTESVSAQVTEEIEITVTEGLGAPVDEAGVAATPKIQHAVPDRGRARDLFERLATLTRSRRKSSMQFPTGAGPGTCSNGSPRCPQMTRSGSASAASWSSCTSRWWNTWRGGSATGESGWTT
jgi:hypothetical protein